MTTHTATDTTFDFAPKPGRILQRELDARSISQAQLAARTGLSTKHINLVIKGTAALSPEVAVTLEQILGTPAETWLALEAVHQAHEVREQRRAALSDYSEWAGSFPRRILVDRGIIGSADVGAKVAAKLLDFFSVASPGAFVKTWLEPQASYKRSQLHVIDQNLTALWLRLSEVSASQLIDAAAPFDAALLGRIAKELPRLTTKEPLEAFDSAQQLLLTAGVVLVYVPEISGTRISGVSRWVNGTPMVAVTSRYKSLDSLWFTILHEIAHVLLHPKRSTYIDLHSKANDDADSQESAANRFAQNHLVPPAHQRSLDAISSVSEIRALADELGVSPSLIAGQWAFRKNVWNGPVARLRTKVDLAELLS